MCSVVVQPLGFLAPVAFRGVSGPLQRQLHTLQLSGRTQQSRPEEKALPQPSSVPALVRSSGASGLLACSAGSLLGVPFCPQGSPTQVLLLFRGSCRFSSGLRQHGSPHTLHLSPSGFVALPDVISCGWASGEQLRFVRKCLDFTVS